MKQKQNIVIAKGSWQALIWNMLLAGNEVTNPVSWLKGAARNYSDKYRESFSNLLHRAKTAGYTIQRTPGVRGGEWSATYRITAMPLNN